MGKMKIPYRVDPPAYAMKPWLKRVEDVVPEHGNGWDIKGPFVAWQGMEEEGTLLCMGYGRCIERLALGRQQWPKSEWWALKVCRDTKNNVKMLRGPGALPVVGMTNALQEFPQLQNIATKPMFGVQYRLLVALTHQKPPEKRAPAGRIIDL